MLDELRIRNQNFPKAQVVSIGLHAAFLGLLLIPFANQMRVHFPPPGPWILPPGPFREPPMKFLREIGGKSGGGGQNEAAPAGRGPILFSAIPLAPVIRVTNPNAFAVPPSVVGPPELQYQVDANHWGVPWSKVNSDSLGTGCCKGPGDGKGPTVGNQNGGGSSEFDGPGPPGSVAPACSYCPNPSFTDEAIKAKYQGTVVLRVLVSAEGRAERIQVMKGVGMGLDDRATETVRTWRFRPGRAPNGTAVRSTILVEVTFRQF